LEVGRQKEAGRSSYDARQIPVIAFMILIQLPKTWPGSRTVKDVWLAVCSTAGETSTPVSFLLQPSQVYRGLTLPVWFAAIVYADLVYLICLWSALQELIGVAGNFAAGLLICCSRLQLEVAVVGCIIGFSAKCEIVSVFVSPQTLHVPT
jgi:hypothetical protein